jgi:hypothetical protein
MDSSLFMIGLAFGWVEYTKKEVLRQAQKATGLPKLFAGEEGRIPYN